MTVRIIKFGGSVITAGHCKNYFNKKNTSRLAHEIAPHCHGCIIVHGTGLIGKPPARTYGYVHDGILPREKGLIALKIRDALRLLNQRVVETLHDAAVPAIAFDSQQCFSQTMQALASKSVLKTLQLTLDNGFVPVFYGDLMLRHDGSFKVFSSDAICLILARALRPASVFFLSNVPGVFACKDGRGAAGRKTAAKKITPATSRLMSPSHKDLKDVSGGMSEKVAVALEISRYAEKCRIASGLEAGVLKKLLTGRQAPGTLIAPD